MSDFDFKYNIIDEKIPPHTLMTARYKKSFAYYTVKERLPVHLTQVIDNLSKDKEKFEEEYGADVREELKEIIGQISKLKYELQTDKPMTELTGSEPDLILWNNFLSTLTPENNSYFSTCWLYAECYMYRRIRSIFESTTLLKKFDYFKKQKETALIGNIEVIESVLQKTRGTVNLENFGSYFIDLLKLNLWGNRCDLSISAGKEVKQTEDPLSVVESWDEYILINNADAIWNKLNTPNTETSNDRIIDFVNDNAGYEFFTDLLVAEFLIDHDLAKKIRFHVKALPWFISDVNASDFHWTIDYFKNNESEILQNFGNKLSKYVEDGKFELQDINYFWTSPYEFYRMKEIDPDLHEKLSEAYLVIFKGDLNYRKLISDFTWDFTEEFSVCLRDFKPTNICSLRTVKADLICGLKPGVADKLTEKDPDWMVTGQYGVIKYSAKNNEIEN